MFDLGGMDWRDSASWIKQREEEHGAAVLRDALIEQIASIHLAAEMRLGEEVVEGFVNRVWDGTREKLRDPDQMDIVLRVMFEALASAIMVRISALRHDYGLCGCGEEVPDVPLDTIDGVW